MNIKLEKLFAEYNFSAKDRHECLQIYNMLPAHKKARLIDHFDEIAASVQGFQDELKLEQEILFGKALENIEAKIAKNKKSSLSEKIHSELLELRSMI